MPHIVCTVFILSRVWSRLYLLRKWFLDDSLIIAAWTFSTAVCVVYSIAASSPHIREAVIVNSTSNRHDDDFNSDTIKPYMLRTYLGLIFYQLCLCLTKLSILAFYLRMFNSRPAERRLAWATVVWVLLFGIPMLAMSLFQCHPAPGEFFGHHMKCFGFNPLLITSASLHTATDAWLILLIIPCITRLEISPRQKAALAIVLSLSIFVIAASMTRLQLSLHGNYRPSGAGVQITNTLAFFVMTILECDIALICASAPTLRPLLARVWPRLGMGEPAQPYRQHYVDGDGNSVDLTSVVSYHGYPWTQPTTPITRSKNGSIANMHVPMPAPPVPVAMSLAHRTPTTLSLRSFMSSITPRSRGATLTAGERRAEDRTVLLTDDKDVERRRSSVGFEGYYEQYCGYGEDIGRRKSKRLSGVEIGQGRWRNSQESFVDPLSPYRLSPVSDFSGTTYAAISDPESTQRMTAGSPDSRKGPEGEEQPTR